MSDPGPSIFPLDDRLFCLSLIDWSESIAELFDQQGLQGGGYTWLGIAEALLELHNPALSDSFEVFDAEGDNMYAYSTSKDMLEEFAELLRRAMVDRAFLLAAMKHAGDELE